VSERRQRLMQKQRGMTLVEIMVVVVIISLVVGTVGVAVFNALQTAQEKTTRTQMKAVADALDLYKLNNRRYPSTAEGLQALTQTSSGGRPTMELVPKDAWGNDFVYIYPGSHNSGKFDILSYGSDGVAGNDDIGNWEEPAGN